jgi:hypothetical protein
VKKLISTSIQRGIVSGVLWHKGTGRQGTSPNQVVRFTAWVQPVTMDQSKGGHTLMVRAPERGTGSSQTDCLALPVMERRSSR